MQYQERRLEQEMISYTLDERLIMDSLVGYHLFRSHLISSSTAQCLNNLNKSIECNIAEAAYLARASTRAQVYESITRLVLNKSSNCQCTHHDAANCITGLTLILETAYNLNGSINGMSKLLIKDSPISKIINRCRDLSNHPQKIKERIRNGIRR